MEHESAAQRVLIKPDSGHPGFLAYVLIGSSSDLRAVLESLLAAVSRIEGNREGGCDRFFGMQVGDATSRYDCATVAVHVDPDLAKHRARGRSFWRFYDSSIAGLVALIILLFAIVGMSTVVGWLR